MIPELIEVRTAASMVASAMPPRLMLATAGRTEHQENIYRKLATRDRLTTVLHAQRLGLVVKRD